MNWKLALIASFLLLSGCQSSKDNEPSEEKSKSIKDQTAKKRYPQRNENEKYTLEELHNRTLDLLKKHQSQNKLESINKEKTQTTEILQHEIDKLAEIYNSYDDQSPKKLQIQEKLKGKMIQLIKLNSDYIKQNQPSIKNEFTPETTFSSNALSKSDSSNKLGKNMNQETEKEKENLNHEGTLLKKSKKEGDSDTLLNPITYPESKKPYKENKEELNFKPKDEDKHEQMGEKEDTPTYPIVEGHDKSNRNKVEIDKFTSDPFKAKINELTKQYNQTDKRNDFPSIPRDIEKKLNNLEKNQSDPSPNSQMKENKKEELKKSETDKIEPELESKQNQILTLEELRQKYPNDLRYSGNSKTNRISLTFDDGPDMIYTPKILDILKQYRVKATFFLIGERVKAYPEVVRRIKNEGHEIGNHSFSHKYLLKLKKSQFEEEVNETEEVFKIIGVHNTRLFRPPFGVLNEEQLLFLSKKGYTVVNWDVDSEDWKGGNKTGIERNVLNKVKPGSIILQHCSGDQELDLSGTIEALPTIIEQMKKEGKRFVTISKLLNE